MNQIVYGCSSVCAKISNCGNCAGTRGCGWCDDRKMCVGADQQFSNCFLSHSCPELSGFRAGSFIGGMFLVIGLGVVGFGILYAYRYFQKSKGADYAEVN